MVQDDVNQTFIKVRMFGHQCCKRPSEVCKLKCSIPDARRTVLLKNDQLRMAAPSMLDNWKHLVSVAVGVLLINSKAIKATVV